MKKLIIVVVLLVACVAGYLVLAKLDKNRVDPEVQRQREAAIAFLEGNRADIEKVARRLDALAGLAGREDWIPAGEKQGKAALGEPLLVWGFQLREAPVEGVDDTYTDCRELDPHLDWLATGDPLAAWMAGSVERLEDPLRRAGASHWILAEVEELQKPEMTELTLDGKDGSMGSFSPGTLRFAVAVVDPETLEVIAHGHGVATSSDRIELRASSDVLTADLWSQAERAARDLAARLTE